MVDNENIQNQYYYFTVCCCNLLYAVMNSPSKWSYIKGPEIVKPKVHMKKGPTNRCPVNMAYHIIPKEADGVASEYSELSTFQS